MYECNKHAVSDIYYTIPLEHNLYVKLHSL